jgi:hypothetical protein
MVPAARLLYVDDREKAPDEPVRLVVGLDVKHDTMQMADWKSASNRSKGIPRADPISYTFEVKSPSPYSR